MNALSTKSKLQILHLRINNVSISVELKYIEKVLLLPSLEIIPNSPNYVVGLMNIGGNSIAVIDLALRLGLIRNQSYSVNTPILLCTQDGYQNGIIVDQILGLAEIEENDIQMHKEFSDPDANFSATICLNNELSLLVNLKHILAISLVSDTIKKNKFNNALIDISEIQL